MSIIGNVIIRALRKPATEHSLPLPANAVAFLQLTTEIGGRDEVSNREDEKYCINPQWQSGMLVQLRTALRLPHFSRCHALRSR